MFPWKKSKKDAVSISAADAAFMDDVSESLLAQTTPGSRLVTYMILLVVVVGVTWAHFARVEEITKGEAKIVSKSREQVIQSLEGGILAEMSAHEGDIVESGQVLLKIDPIRSQVVERRNRYRSDANSELIKLEMELSQTSENLVGRADVVERTTITAPVRGTVKNVRVNTVGGVIQPGEHILEIVPLEDQLLVEGKIRPSDVAFLRPGLPAKVKITAYDYGIYGGLDGTVELISPDTLKDEEKGGAGRPDSTYYRVTVLTEKSALQAGGKELPIIPGMIASVEIRTGEKTVLEYLLKPVLKAREAFRER